MESRFLNAGGRVRLRQAEEPGGRKGQTGLPSIDFVLNPALTMGVQPVFDVVASWGTSESA